MTRLVQTAGTSTGDQPVETTATAPSVGTTPLDIGTDNFALFAAIAVLIVILGIGVRRWLRRRS